MRSSIYIIGVFLIIFLSFFSCQKEDISKTKHQVEGEASITEDCDSPNEVKKKIEEELKKAEVGESVSLQGNTGCSLDGNEKNL